MTTTYEQYCEVLDSFIILSEETEITEGLVEKLSGLQGQIGKFLVLAKKEITSIGGQIQVPIDDLIKALKSKDIYGILKHFGFSLLGMIKAVHLGANTIIKSYTGVFKELHKSKVFEKIRKGVMTVDEVLEKYPVLKKITGPAIAGVLLWCWLNISFIGQFDYDFDISAMFDALKGNFSIEDLFASPQGLTMLAFVATNIASGGVLSVSWLGSTKANLLLAFIYTVLKKRGIDHKQIKSIIVNRKTIKENLEEGFFGNRKKNVEQLGKQILDIASKIGKDRATSILDVAAKDIENKEDLKILSTREFGYTNKTQKDEELYQLYKKYFLSSKTFGFLNTYAIYDSLMGMLK